jgi:serine protease Do
MEVGENDELKKATPAGGEAHVQESSKPDEKNTGLMVQADGYKHFAVPTPHKKLGAGQGGGLSRRASLIGVVVVLAMSLCGGFLGGWLAAEKNAASPSSSTQKEIVSSEGQLINSVAKKVSPSVVSINVTSQSAAQSVFSFGQVQSEKSAGTGIIISANGLIVTNRHVVPEGTTSVSVTLADGTQLDDVKVIGRTAAKDSLDIAFLKINDARGKKLVPARLGDSSKMQVGDRVVAIGNALGQFQNTVTSGIISGYGRTVQASDQSGDPSSSENLQDLLQTDAAINEGNSGGPLVNANGEVIGINTAVAGGAQSVGFAIPTNDVSGLIKTVLKTGTFRQPYLGVRYISLTNDIAAQLGLKVTRGAYVIPADKNGGQAPVLPGSPAEKAGIKSGDVVQAIEGAKIDDNHSLTALLVQHAVGDRVALQVLRDGRQLDVTVTLDAAKTNND